MYIYLANNLSLSLSRLASRSRHFGELAKAKVTMHINSKKDENIHMAFLLSARMSTADQRLATQV